MRILVVDDEVELAGSIHRILVQNNYTVDTALDGLQALDKIFVESYDLVLLDIMLPRRDGFAILRELRQAGKSTPVLMLSARDGVNDRVKGLDLGADDYLAKPFSMEELLARIRALLRRVSGQGSPILRAGPVSLDTVGCQVTRENKPVHLTPKEFSILEFLLYNKGRVVSRATIAEHVWGGDFDPLTMSNSIDVHIKNLRQKLGDQKGAVIRTVRGMGYMIREGHQ